MKEEKRNKTLQQTQDEWVLSIWFCWFSMLSAHFFPMCYNYCNTPNVVHWCWCCSCSCSYKVVVVIVVVSATVLVALEFSEHLQCSLKTWLQCNWISSQDRQTFSTKQPFIYKLDALNKYTKTDQVWAMCIYTWNGFY